MDRPVAKILITRPREGSERFALELAQAMPCPMPVLISPVMEIAPLPDLLPLDHVKGLIVTSQNGVDVLVQKTDRRDLPVYAVGARTTATAKEAGFKARQMGEDAEELVEAILRLGPKTPLLHLRGEVARGDVAQRLSTHGILTREKVVYAQTPCNLTPEAISLLEGTSPVVLPLFSARSARLLAQQVSGGAPRYVVAMSWAVASELPHGWAKTIIIASRPDSPAMADGVASLFDGDGFIVTPEIRG
ncbi:uroporphyrinogen-III synthase [Donghicola mangrovi]|uniref:Uroporphyrinogen-III synthase n=1 Tax=Donghicola mangrovi TaxID=2729614 RepID=A0A850Q5T1_9RHOB|nr:uroporphyrinogen-III synthase [Donghicola mangrovi]NVO22418.1 uroporphyrinogen-III synthase [Donghicola mangrovi]